jgi:presenilin-like A22 family membrane protease
MTRAEEQDDDVVLEHPNRDKASSKSVRAAVVLVLLVSLGLMLVVTLGGWDELQGSKALLVGYLLVYVLAVYLVLRWNRGILPVIAALAIILGIFAAVSAPGWFDRDATGFAPPAIDADLLGLVCIVLAIVQLVLIVIAMLAFRQAWNVEVERRRDGGPATQPPPPPRGAPAPA